MKQVGVFGTRLSGVGVAVVGVEGGFEGWLRIVGGNLREKSGHASVSLSNEGTSDRRSRL